MDFYRGEDWLPFPIDLKISNSDQRTQRLNNWKKTQCSLFFSICGIFFFLSLQSIYNKCLMAKNPLPVAPPGPEGFLSRTHTKANAWTDS